MDSNQKRFVADVLDLLNELDEGLLQLESNPQVRAPLEQVFRTMHTIKGGANMFGFTTIGELAHHLEGLYDLVRQGKMQVTDKLMSITLQAFDKVRDLLKEKDIAKINGSNALQEYILAAKQYHVHENQLLENTTSSGQKDELVTFLLTITPIIKLTPDGNHPLLFIIEDIAALGTSRSLMRLQSSGDVQQWLVFIATTSPQPELESYFLFVENECQVEYDRLTTGSLFELPEFSGFLDQVVNDSLNKEKLEALIKLHQERQKQQASMDIESDKDVVERKKSSGNDSYIKVNKHKVDDLLNWISELIILQAQLTTTAATVQINTLTEVAEQLEIVTDRLRDTALEIGLVPIETLVTKFKRLVRDLSKQLDKKVNFLSEGADTEMDKDVIEMMTEPMIHIIRNAIDHGIETPSQRKEAGKTEHGTVKLKAFNSSSYVNIIISDDGKGISKDAVLKKAVEKGIVQADADLTEDEILELIFHPGLSTATQVSSVSGRGVGMDVVKEKIDELRGAVTVKSHLGKGTSIHIKLPLTRSMVEGMLVKVASTRYVVPLHVIDRIDRIAYQDLLREDKVDQMVVVNEHPLHVLSLRKFFKEEAEVPKTSDIISMHINGVRKGIAVDKIEGKIQTVMKPLGEAYRQQDFISGSTILGNGSLALVIDPFRLTF